MSTGVLISCMLCVVLAILWALMQRNTTPPASMGNRILFLIAHPDDESMFFSPLMFALKQSQKSPKLFILCLSPGHPRNAPQPNLGTIRTNELLKASKLLGVDECAVEALTDGPNETGWTEEAILPMIGKYVKSWKIDSIVTFDKGGVSGHPNHISTHHAADKYVGVGQSSTAGDLQLWNLVSYPTLAKYTAFLLHEWNLMTCTADAFVVANPRAAQVWSLMAAHHSQFVWFRKLSVAFSSYTYFNEYKCVKKSNK